MATRDYYKGVTIQYNGDATNLSKVLGQINGEMRQSQSAARALDTALRFDPSGLALVKDRAEVAAKQVKLTEDRVKYLKEALANAQDPEVISRLTRESDIAEARLKSLREQLVQLNARQAMGDTGFGRAAAAVTEFGDNLQAVGSKMADVGDKATMHLTVPIVAFATATMGAATSVDSALSDVRKTVDATEEEYQALHDTAIEYSKTNGVTAEQVLQVQALGAQLGYAKDELEMIGRVGSGMDIATDMNAEQATTEMAQFANITGMAHDKTENYASTVIALGNTTATTESKISGMAQSIAAAGAQVGMSESEILGMSAALSSMGLEAQGGGSNISKIMSQIDKDVATGSENIKVWAEAAGTSADEFAARWRSKPIEALQMLFSGMRNATEQGGNLSVILEGLGISSAQATDVAKRLANGSDLLAQSVETANRAWQENTALSDEVASRNESLAAKFQMLQNRVTAIMEQIGKPLADALLDILDAAQPVFDLIESGAKAFSDLDEGQQKLIVSAVAMAAAFGPVSSVLGRVTGDIGGIVSAVGGAGEGITTFVEAIKVGFGPMESLTLASEGLAGALSAGLVGVGIAAVLVAVGALVSAYQQWEEHNNLVRDATEGLAAATEAASASYEAYAEQAESAGRSAEEIREANEETLQSLVDFAEKITGTMDDVGANAAMAETYANTMKEIGSQGRLSADDLAKLKNAVEEYNSVTGAAITITNEQTGALSVLPGQLDEVTAAYKRQAEQQAYAELYKDAIKEQAKATQELDRVNVELAKNQDIVNNSTSLMSEEAHEAAANVEALWQSQQDLSKASEAAADNVMYWGQKIGDSTSHFSSVETAMQAAGVSEQQYAQLTKEQLAEIATAFDGTIDSIAAKLAQFGLSVKATGDSATKSAQKTADNVVQAADSGASRALGVQKSANDAAIKEQQRANEQVNREMQRAFDAEYRNQQKAFERKTKELSKQLEQEVKMRQAALEEEEDNLSKHHAEIVKMQEKANERANKELSKQQAAEYKEKSAGLAAIEEAESKSNERRLSEQRKANDRQEKELKSALDKRVASVKSALDAEIAARRKANQTELKELKEAQSQATKAFKAETSARIKEMEREYQKQVSLLEQSNGISDIDDRIKQLQSETDAEDRANKERERNEKTSELRKAVEKAKSRRKRAEAEKELNDYLAQIESERRDQERKDEIARLNEQKDLIKEETAAKKAELKEQYEVQKDQYETQRAEQLEREDKQREEDYERLSEYLSNQLDKRREAADLLIEQQREQASAQLEVMREQHSEQESAFKEMLDNRLTATRDAHSTELEQLKEQQAETAELQRENQQESLEILREGQAVELEEMRSAHSVELEQMREANSETLEAEREAQQESLRQLKESQQDALQAMRDAQSDALDAMRQNGKDMVGVANNTTGELKKDQGKKLSDAEAWKNQTKEKYRQAALGMGENLTRTLFGFNPTLANIAGQLYSSAVTQPNRLPSDYQEIGCRSTSNLSSSLIGGTSRVGGAAAGVANAVSGNLDRIPSSAANNGSSAMSSLQSNISYGGTGVANAASMVVNNVNSRFDGLGNNSYSWGSDMMFNLNEGIVSYWNNVLLPNLVNIANNIADLLAHSKPKEGPLKDDDQWFYHMGQNLNRGLMRSVPEIMGTVYDLADGISDGMDPDVDLGLMSDSLARTLEEMNDQAHASATKLVDTFSYAFERIAENTRDAMSEMSGMLEIDAHRMRDMLAAASLGARLDANLNYVTAAISFGAKDLAPVAARDTNIYVNLNLDDIHIENDMDLRQTAKDLATELAREIEAAIA